MDTQELMQQIPRNSNSQMPDFEELQKRLNDLESKVKAQPSVELTNASINPTIQSQQNQVKDRTYFQDRIRMAG